ncbi:MAG: hypothetical protein U0R79_03280 [Propionicimonas sp.]
MAGRDRRPARTAGDADFGEVDVRDLPFSAVQSLFADEPGAATLVAAAAQAPHEDLAQVDAPAVVALLEGADLLCTGRGMGQFGVRVEPERAHDRPHEGRTNMPRSIWKGAVSFGWSRSR